MKQTIWTTDLKEYLGMALFFSVYMIAGIFITVIAFVEQHPSTFQDQFGMFMCGVYDTAIFPLTIGFWVTFFMKLSENKKKLKEK